MARRFQRQDHSALPIFMAVIGSLFAVAQFIIFVLTVVQFCRNESIESHSKRTSGVSPDSNSLESPNKPPRIANNPSQSRSATSRTSAVRGRYSKRAVHKFFAISSSIASFWFAVCAICAALDTLYYSMPFIPESYPENSLMIGISAALASYLGRIVMSAVFIGRLHIIFKDTTIAYSKWMLWSLITLTVISFCLFSLAAIIFLEYAKYDDLSMYTFVISNVFDICFSLLLVYLFLRGLWKVMMICHQSKEKLMTLMTKYSVLVAWALISTSITIIYASIAFFATGDTLAVYNAYEFLLTVDSFINGFCLYLNYPFGTELYGKVCVTCDVCFKRLCSRLSERIPSSTPSPRPTPSRPAVNV